MKYILVGGNAFFSHEGMITFTSLKVRGATDDREEIIQMYRDKHEDCCGLLVAVDTTTGEEIKSLLSQQDLLTYLDFRFSGMPYLSAQAREWITAAFTASLSDRVNGDNKLECGPFKNGMLDGLAKHMGLESPNMENFNFHYVWNAFFCE